MIAGCSAHQVSRLGGKVRPAVLLLESKSPKMLFQGLPVDVLCKHVRRIDGTWNFGEKKILCSNFILDPEVGCMQVPDLPEPPRFTDTNGGCGVGLNIKSHLHAEIC